MSYTGIDPSSAGSFAVADRGTSVVDANSDVEGTYTTSRDLRIEGKLTGSINCDGVLFIADGADVNATVEAASIIVSGRLSGAITCRGRLEITSSGAISGEVQTASLVIVEGARYEGKIAMTGPAEEVAGTDALDEPGASDASDSFSLLRRYASSPSDPDDSDDADPEATES